MASKPDFVCTGLKFRGNQSQYFDPKRKAFHYKESFTLLKTKSCKCFECQDLIEHIDEGLIDCTYWFLTFKHEPINDGQLFRLKVLEWDSEWDAIRGDISYPVDIKMEKIDER
ncbi:MAG: hypothetical protein GY909_16220 [Oligoflexia bacterium]|nr:hypothetical protein [Oligoflexia bacterium]